MTLGDLQRREKERPPYVVKRSNKGMYGDRYLDYL